MLSFTIAFVAFVVGCFVGFTVGEQHYCPYCDCPHCNNDIEYEEDDEQLDEAAKS